MQYLFFYQIKFLKRRSKRRNILPDTANPIAGLRLSRKLNPITTIAAVYPTAPPQPVKDEIVGQL